MHSSRQSRLLASLFQQIDPEERITVLNIGNALPETVRFFSDFRCKLYFVDLLAELPFLESEVETEDNIDDGAESLTQRFARLLQLPPDTGVDIVLFWDLFNYLNETAIAALLENLRPHLHAATVGHGFTVHNRRTPQLAATYSIESADSLVLRSRSQPLSHYSPHAQNNLQRIVHDFNFDRSVLLPDSQLEFILSARRAS
tara:strand:+ start:51860 stop:52462 length:603 start_codon:yes stop_codon:yes gene_type:complete